MKLLACAAGLCLLALPAAAQGYYGDRYDDAGYDTHIVTNTPNNPTNTNGVQSGYYAAMDNRMAWNDRYGRRGPLAYHDYDRDERDNGYYRDRQYDRFLRDNSLVDDNGDDGY